MQSDTPSGGIVPSAKRRLTGELRGYTLSITSTQAKIGMEGLVISVY